MRLPSVKTLEPVFGERAERARAYLERWRLKRWSTDVMMERLDQYAGTCGVECIWTDGRQDTLDGPRYLYLNTGDTYAATLILDRDYGRLRVGSWGDLVEQAERYPHRWGRIT